jgi:hypothetical protein
MLTHCKRTNGIIGTAHSPWSIWRLVRRAIEVFEPAAPARDFELYTEKGHVAAMKPKKPDSSSKEV